MIPALIDTRKARLYTALAARDMTTDELAGLVGVDRARIHRWHSPRPVAPRPTKGPARGGAPSAVQTAAIAAALDILPGALEPGGPWGPLVGLPEDEVARMRRELAEWETMPEEERARRVARSLEILGIAPAEVES